MDDLLYRLYEPILWRALKLSNEKVRKYAATLLIDAFPLLSEENANQTSDLENCLDSLCVMELN